MYKEGKNLVDTDKKTVCVGMSGGVDSSVAALLLKEQGYNVIGVTMQIWQDEDRDVVSAHAGCCGLSAVDDARRVASQLDIPYYVMNFKEEFKKYVIDYFVDEYKCGRTPNPCIACNRYVNGSLCLRDAWPSGAIILLRDTMQGSYSFQWQIYSPGGQGNREGSDICSLQSHPGAARQDTHAGWRVQQA